MGLNPFRAGQCLSTNDNRSLLTKIAESQSLSSRAMSFDVGTLAIAEEAMSQSLSFRAMSFDTSEERKPSEFFIVSIPFDQGDVFRQNDKR